MQWCYLTCLPVVQQLLEFRIIFCWQIGVAKSGLPIAHHLFDNQSMFERNDGVTSFVEEGGSLFV